MQYVVKLVNRKLIWLLSVFGGVMNQSGMVLVENVYISYNAYRVHPFTLCFTSHGQTVGYYSASRLCVNFGRLEYLESTINWDIELVDMGDQESDLIEIITDTTIRMGYVVLLKSTTNLVACCSVRNLHFNIAYN